MILILFASCKKANLRSYNTHIIGDYEWYYSVKDLGNSYSFDSQDDKYGVRIKRNSKLYIFKNDEIIYKGTIESIWNSNQGVYGFSVRDNGSKILFEIHGDILQSTNWPYEGYTNKYKKNN